MVTILGNDSCRGEIKVSECIPNYNISPWDRQQLIWEWAKLLSELR
jgi:hypothetical protein